MEFFANLTFCVILKPKILDMINPMVSHNVTDHLNAVYCKLLISCMFNLNRFI